MKTLAQAARDLRQFTGLSQKELADRAGVSVSIIQKMEGGERQTAKRTTLLSIMRAASRTISVPDDVMRSFAVAAGMKDYDQKMVLMNQIVKSPAFRSLERMRAFADSLPSDEATAVFWLFDLIDASSPMHVLKMLENVAQISGIELSMPVKASAGESRQPTTMDVHTPPVRRPDGSVEKIITTYEVQDAPPVSDSRTRRDRRHA